MRAFLLLLPVLLIAACGSARKQMERAMAYEKEGMLDQAHDSYAALYARRPREVQAHIGMKRTAQALFDRMQDRASAAYLMRDLAAGDNARNEAAIYKSAMDRRGFDLQWDPALDGKRIKALHAEADRLFAAAEAAYRADRFSEAEDLSAQCTRLDPERRDAEHLNKLARLEPTYREAVRAQELGLWREAYRKFEQVTRQDAAHKDSMARLNACREKAAYTLAYVPLHNRALFANAMGMAGTSLQIEAQLAANVKQEVLGLGDPLIVLVDRDNTDQLLAEQQRQMSGVYDDRYVAEAGKLLGARHVLTAKILRYDDVLRKEIEVQVQLLDAETGRIHMAEIVRVNKQEITRGAPRAQLLERAAKRAALKLAEFDPAKD